MATRASRSDSRDSGGFAHDAHDRARDAGSEVQQHPAYRLLVTLGLVCYGAIHLLLGWLCIQIALGGGGQASPDGALKNLVSKPLGNVLMIVFAIGLFTLVIWKLIEALFGYRHLDKAKKIRRKLSSVGRLVVYAALGASALSLAIGAGSSDSNQSARTASATLMAAPFGQELVGIVGLVVIGVGVYQVVKGVTRKFVRDDLDAGVAEWAKRLGMIGWAVKGVAIALVGLLFVWAAITFDPQKATGMDGALKTLQQQPFGMVLLIAMGLGFACFGVYCFAWSRNVDFENV